MAMSTAPVEIATYGRYTFAKKIIARKTKMKSNNSVNGVPSSTGNVSLIRKDHVRQVTPDRYRATVRIRYQFKIRTSDMQTMLQRGKVDNVK